MHSKVCFYFFDLDDLLELMLISKVQDISVAAVNCLSAYEKYILYYNWIIYNIKKSENMFVFGKCEFIYTVLFIHWGCCTDCSGQVAAPPPDERV